MSTRSYIAFTDGQTTTGVYVHHDGDPATRIPDLSKIYRATFSRDLNRMRATLLERTTGWLTLSPDAGRAAEPAADGADRLVPGVGMALAGTGYMIATGDDVFEEEFTYLFDTSSRGLTVYQHGQQILHRPEDRWAPIGPQPYGRRLLPIIPPDQPGSLCLTGQTAVYSEGHISRLMRTLDLEPGDRLGIDDGGDLFDFHHAAVEAGLLPGNTWFCTDGDGIDSDGGWIALPYELPGVEITTRYFDAGDYAPRWSEDRGGDDTRSALRELLEAMQAAIATATRSLNGWRAELPAFVLNIRHPDYETDTWIDGYTPEIHTLDLGADFDGHARDPEQALAFAATQLTCLYDWPHTLRRIAAAQIERAVGISAQALMLTKALAQEVVGTEALALAGSVLGVEVPGRPISRATREAWEAARPAPTAEYLSGYAEACRAAATRQGLDPIVAALTAAGIDNEVEQTGGFCMVVNVPTGLGHYYILTASEDPDGAGCWLLVRRSDTDEDDEGQEVGSAVPTDQVIDLLGREQQSTVTAGRDGEDGDEDGGTVRTIVDHRNDIGDWCPWSNTTVTADYDDDRCPAACRSSWIDEDDTAGQVLPAAA